MGIGLHYDTARTKQPNVTHESFKSYMHTSVHLYAYTYIHTREKDFLKNNYGNLNMK